MRLNREMHLNIFDRLLEDKSQFNFVFVASDDIEKKDNENYCVQFSTWTDAKKLETKTNYTLERENDTFKIKINDLFWVPIDYDSLNIQ